ncbi:5-carboxymethyl-2-hydroxymuconate isomerase [Paraburkholderia caballeronis]|uniref:5-carboxymethyl-2-hydroxymuconate Delta-isomerase n=1 Tax=Paraburkholderia caballeronis TaxID=416943 RepID=UPI001064EB13|nr:5-carboxymethyl-2-hydroxymuconate Delta-isomerase [Paraburkholderia caballeronis]TDV25535.1 5-carboxymethyl-2-hydroxymuconate isomerase [Paraburkholderia caballeronis]
MPHLIIEYSPGLFQPDELAPTLAEANAALVASGAIQKEADLKSRMIALDTIRVGTEDALRGFVYAQLRVLPGRSEETRAAMTACVADVLRKRCGRPPGMQVQLSVEIVEMERASYVKEVL